MTREIHLCTAFVVTPRGGGSRRWLVSYSCGGADKMLRNNLGRSPADLIGAADSRHEGPVGAFRCPEGGDGGQYFFFFVELRVTGPGIAGAGLSCFDRVRVMQHAESLVMPEVGEPGRRELSGRLFRCYWRWRGGYFSNDGMW